MGNTPQRVATSVKGNWKLRHPHLQDITHFYGILRETLDSLDWNGALRRVEDVNVPSFSSDQFSVKVGSSS